MEPPKLKPVLKFKRSPTDQQRLTVTVITVEPLGRAAPLLLLLVVATHYTSTRPWRVGVHISHIHNILKHPPSSSSSSSLSSVYTFKNQFPSHT